MNTNSFTDEPCESETRFLRTDTQNQRNMSIPQIVTLPGMIQAGSLRLDFLSGRAFISGKDLSLKRKEYHLLLLLMKNAGKAVSREKIYEEIWNTPIKGDRRAMLKRVSVLKRKLNDANCGYTVKTVYGGSYCFEEVE